MMYTVNTLQGVTSIIYAWGDSDPVDVAPSHESQRGTQGIALWPSDEIATDLSGSESFLLTVKNVSFPFDAESVLTVPNALVQSSGSWIVGVIDYLFGYNYVYYYSNTFTVKIVISDRISKCALLCLLFKSVVVCHYVSLCA